MEAEAVYSTPLFNREGIVPESEMFQCMALHYENQFWESLLISFPKLIKGIVTRYKGRFALL